MDTDLSPEIKAVEKYSGERSYLIQILHDVQKEYNYLPEKALRNIASMMEISLVDVYGVATFFTSFSLEPKGKHIVTICMGTACHVRNSPGVLDEARRFLDIEPGQTTEDILFSLETVNCLGACAMGPIVVVDGEYHGEMTPSKVKKVLERVSKEEGRG
ncbi:MAG: NADH-quinone oxidoreductase subunit NuoE [Actinomycetota bacterium]|nr:NADH-quinone oxidoreductase subunit NuoE [Actinomycetota bacterium]